MSDGGFGRTVSSFASNVAGEGVSSLKKLGANTKDAVSKVRNPLSGAFRQKTSAEGELHEVAVAKDEKTGSLGLVLGPDVYAKEVLGETQPALIILQLKAGGAAAKSGKLKPGDRLVSVNGVGAPLTLDSSKVSGAIAAGGTITQLVIFRPASLTPGWEVEKHDDGGPIYFVEGANNLIMTRHYPAGLPHSEDGAPVVPAANKIGASLKGAGKKVAMAMRIVNELTPEESLSWKGRAENSVECHALVSTTI
uniref:PDZ domain-containing protein n=1 Tax=Prymnesium polylepis TaxID=72548 RepID=A0A7S4IYW1_9EUKA|mmetsp:Transcript_368/g.662  ORF Transcript_368/g.662 Transcript_368/m.662 type:complete len:251 (+) Transcript_368:13-765(+)